MIKAVRANNKSFKTVRFEPGFNVILAERTETSTDKDSRNGLGKTTLIEIIHFCLGSTNFEPLEVKELEDWTFSLDLNLGVEDYTISRNTSNNGTVHIVGNFSDWEIQPEKISDDGSGIMKISSWTKMLGKLAFNLDLENTDTYYPSFRGIISYLIRKGVGGYQDAFRFFPQQKDWSIQTHNAYLLGINHEYAKLFQIIKDKKKALKDLKNALSQGLLPSFDGSIGELESEAFALEINLKELTDEIQSFKVHPQYYKIQQEANEYTEHVHKLTNDYTTSQQILNKYQQTITDEKDVSINQVKTVYSEAGLVFDSRLVKKLEEVMQFHEQIVVNRKTYLTDELDRLQLNIDKLKDDIKRTSDSRSQLMQILKTHGALDEYSLLQDRINSLKQQINNIRDKVQKLKDIEGKESELTIELEELLKNARKDLEERTEHLKIAIGFFNSNSQFLYSEPGTLSVDITRSGYKYKVDIKRATSQGVNYMKVFCYDLATMQINSTELKRNWDTLIHDSTIFDGVDERQVSKALELAINEANDKNFQYICTLNSDSIPRRDFSQDFLDKFNSFVRITLKDDTISGGILGIRY